MVDDYPVSQLVASAIIEQLGYQVDLANSGPEALTAIQFTQYDIILMDCVMPVMDGYEATSLIRRLEGPGRHTPIVALTAESMTAIVRNAWRRVWTTTSPSRSTLPPSAMLWRDARRLSDAPTRRQSPGCGHRVVDQKADRWWPPSTSIQSPVI